MPYIPKKKNDQNDKRLTRAEKRSVARVDAARATGSQAAKFWYDFNTASKTGRINAAMRADTAKRRSSQVAKSQDDMTRIRRAQDLARNVDHVPLGSIAATERNRTRLLSDANAATRRNQARNQAIADVSRADAARARNIAGFNAGARLAAAVRRDPTLRTYGKREKGMTETRRSAAASTAKKQAARRTGGTRSQMR